MDKLNFIKEKGDLYVWFKDRKFDDLMSHEKEVREDVEKMKHFEKIYEKTKKFFGDKMIDKDEFFLIFCRTWVNSHSIHTGAGTEIGIALDLGVSMYDHCCRPNLTLVFDGFRAMLRPLSAEVDANNDKTSFISYVDVGRSKYQRRKELLAKWYFWCECERCVDPEDDRLTSMKCTNPQCKEPIIITEDCEVIEKICPACSSVVPKEKVKEAQEYMLSMPTKYNLTFDEEELKKVTESMQKTETILHPENIYYCRLQTVYLQISGSKGVIMQPEAQKMVYENYKRCLPKADRHIGYQLLHLVKSYIEQNKRAEAVQYAYEAMTIFEICFGLQHPYYLQTLALWTFLETKADKTDHELLTLMNFNYNRPIDITPLLEKGEAISMGKKTAMRSH
jgi:SET and MYND domain-containing protein